MLAEIIAQSEYFKSYIEHKSFDEIINEIVDEVVHVEPTALGHTLLPSTAFCLLYRLFQIRLSRWQINLMLAHNNNYVKAVAFLYLRYLLPSSKIWDWFKDYLDDPNLFVPGVDGKEKIELGRFVESLIVEQKFFGTLFPRIPVPIMRDFKKKILLRERDKVENRKNEKYRDEFKPGTRVEAMYHKDKKWYKATIEGYNSKNGTFLVVFDGYSNKEEIPIGKIRKLKEKKVSTSPVISDRQKREKSLSRRSDRENGRHRPREQTRDRSDKSERKKRENGNEKENGRKPSDRKRARDDTRTDERGDDRRDRKSRERRKRSHRGESREKVSRRDSSRRSRERKRRRDDPSASERSRSFSTNRRSARSRTRVEKSSSHSREDDIEKDLDEFIKQRDKDEASAVGRHYAVRPVSYKSCLSVPMQIQTTRQRSFTPPTRPSRRASPVRDYAKVEKKKQPSREHLKKLEELKMIYGDASAKKNDSNVKR